MISPFSLGPKASPATQGLRDYLNCVKNLKYYLNEERITEKDNTEKKPIVDIRDWKTV
jgi:hypothetical protein